MYVCIHVCVCARVCPLPLTPPLQAVAELKAKLASAEEYYGKVSAEGRPPERLAYVNVPRTREEADQARKITHAVGDAQV